ncbi:MAG TPA: cytochrome b N-terminal domain-containing protein [Terriglobia bacterium]|nr:cytochrome b N-terminal domain-containing protein [Terriglobia bacterium]
MKLLYRLWHEFDDRTGISGLWEHVGRHPVPSNTGWWYVFGSATLMALVLQIVTGIALATAYVPSTANAYNSLQFITHKAMLGHLLRGLHYFGASAMVLLIGIHIMRVFLHGSYKYPRELNWLTGALLLLLTLGMAFTGQLLRWDNVAVWSVIVGAEQAGRVPIMGKYVAHFILAGDTVGGATLSRFFAFHVFFIPAVIFAVLGAHLLLVLKHGISEPPVAGRPVDPKTYKKWYADLLKREGKPFWPDAAWRDVVFGVAMIVVLVILAVVVGPPHLASPPDPTILKAYPRPDWYFLWYFAVLALLPPSFETPVIVFGPLLFFAILFIFPLLRNRGERHPLRRPWAIAAVVMIWVMIGTLWIEGKRAPWSPDFDAKPLQTQVIGATSGPVYEGGILFHKKGCEFCHSIAGQGGHRGPDLTFVADRLTPAQMTIRIVNGAQLMPAFGGILTSEQLDDLVAFLKTRKHMTQQPGSADDPSVALPSH